jgi:acyl-CoA thioester hydrolase
LNTNIFTRCITVPASSIDERGHVNNIVYLQWCVDAAEAHWISRTPESLREGHLWYVINHNITYRASAFEGEELEIKTWVEVNKGVRSERHYKITRLIDNKTLVEGQTIWCLLDGKTLRPTKIPDKISNLFV